MGKNKKNKNIKNIYSEETPEKERKIKVDPWEECKDCWNISSKRVHFCFDNFNSNFQEFKDLNTKKEFKDFMKFLITVKEKTRDDIKQDKGLKLTKVNRAKYWNRIAHISPEESMRELRVNVQFRVHGFIHWNYFHLVLLDRNHDICP